MHELSITAHLLFVCSSDLPYQDDVEQANGNMRGYFQDRFASVFVSGTTFLSSTGTTLFLPNFGKIFDHLRGGYPSI